jgi:hypothetical protein
LGAQGLAGAHGLALSPFFFFFFLAGAQGFDGPQGFVACVVVPAGVESAAIADAAGATSALATNKAERVWARWDGFMDLAIKMHSCEE